MSGYSQTRASESTTSSVSGPAVTAGPAVSNSEAAASLAQGAPPAKAAPSAGLGGPVDALVARSPTLSSKLGTMQKAGWTIVWGTDGGGSFADPGAKTVTVDPADKDDPATIAQTLAHEAGHATYAGEAYVGFGSLTKEEYVDKNTMRELRDEAEATISNLQVRDELNQGGQAVDIGVAGAGAESYKALWEKHKKGDLSREELVDAIAKAFAKGETPSNATNMDYGQYYGKTYSDHWDQQHPAPAPKPAPRTS
jgi:type VI secretion system secreted protein VgrG